MCEECVVMTLYLISMFAMQSMNNVVHSPPQCDDDIL